MMNDETDWTATKNELPPQGVVVLTMDSGGHVQKLKIKGSLFFFPDESMYVYYVPQFWKRLAIKKHFLDKPILRSLFWFIVLPHQMNQWANANLPTASEDRCDNCGLSHQSSNCIYKPLTKVQKKAIEIQQEVDDLRGAF